MAAVGKIKAEVLLRIDGMTDLYPVGELEIPLNITTDDKRPGHLTMRAETGEIRRSIGRTRALDKKEN